MSWTEIDVYAHDQVTHPESRSVVAAQRILYPLFTLYVPRQQPPQQSAKSIILFYFDCVYCVYYHDKCVNIIYKAAAVQIVLNVKLL